MTIKHYFLLGGIVGFLFSISAFAQSMDGVSSGVTGFSVWKISSKSVILNWDPLPNADFYKIQVRSANDSERTKTLRIKPAVTKKKIQGLTANTDYIFSICAQINGKCVYGNDISAKTKQIFFLQDDFEQKTEGTVYERGDVRYVEGKEGYGFLNVYKTMSDGGELRANILGYDNSDGQLVDPEIGTVELWVKPTTDLESDTEIHGLFNAWSGDGMNSWDVEVYKNQLSVSRGYAPCVNSYFHTNFTFEKDTWYKLTLTWRGPATKFFIDHVEVGNFKHEPQNVFLGRGEAVYVGDDIFVTDNLRIKTDSNIPVTSLSLEEKGKIQCPGFMELLKENIQEEYRGIALHNFPDEDTREKIKEFIDVLPNTFDGDIKDIVLVEDARYELIQPPSVRANFMAGGSMFLKKSFFDTVEKIEDNAKTFFHEAGHGHIYDNNLGYGGPRGEAKRKEWTDISGIKAYVGECARPSDFVFEDGFLTAYGSTMPDEDLAEWVGITINMYRKNATFSSLLKKSNKKYSPKYLKKLDFLLAKGFINEEMYNRVTRAIPNTNDYIEFN